MLKSIFRFRRKGKETEVKEEQLNLNLATILLLSMSEYIQEAEKSSGLLVPVISDIESAYGRLVRLGLQNSQNAMLLKKQIDERNTIQMNRQRAIDLIRFIKDVHAVYGPKSLVVSQEKFFAVCQKYNLGITILNNYNGVIPARNILDLEEVVSKQNDIRLNNHLFNHSINGHGWLYVNEIINDGVADEAYSYANWLRKEVAKNNGLVRVKAPIYDRYTSACLVDYRPYQHDNLIKLNGEVLQSNTFLIACPKKYINNPKIKVTNRPVDPIVFRFCPYGVVIHTMWGEEAEDQVLKEFEALNGRIAQM